MYDCMIIRPTIRYLKRTTPGHGAVDELDRIWRQGWGNGKNVLVRAFFFGSNERRIRVWRWGFGKRVVEDGLDMKEVEIVRV